jgi:hypothetical protein
MQVSLEMGFCPIWSWWLLWGQLLVNCSSMCAWTGTSQNALVTGKQGSYQDLFLGLPYGRACLFKGWGMRAGMVLIRGGIEVRRALNMTLRGTGCMSSLQLNLTKRSGPDFSVRATLE